MLGWVAAVIGDGDGAAAAVRRADKERCAAVAARDFDRYLSLFDTNVAVFPEQRPLVKGKRAARDLWAPFFDAKGPAMTCTPVTVEVAASGDMAYTTGTYQMKGGEAERSPTQGYGKYVTIWRKVGGRWKVAVDIGNGTPPPQPDFGPPPTL